jgi:hypothetical protein
MFLRPSPPQLYLHAGSLLVPTITQPYIFMEWEPSDGTLVHVVRLDGSEVGGKVIQE